jgi:hypothetical protein
VQEYILSSKLKVASKYSRPCKITKKKPKAIVTAKASKASEYKPKLVALCAHVMENPEIINNMVLKKGNANTGIGSIPAGGHEVEKIIDGLKEAWKKAQKKPKNNIISDNINSKNPETRPLFTTKVW